MKKSLSFLLVVVFMVGLLGCNAQGTTEGSVNTSSSSGTNAASSNQQDTATVDGTNTSGFSTSQQDTNTVPVSGVSNSGLNTTKQGNTSDVTNKKTSSNGGGSQSVSTKSTTRKTGATTSPKPVTLDELLKDKMLGGTVIDYLWKSLSVGDYNCLGQLKNNGMNWIRTTVTMKEAPGLENKPVSQWTAQEASAAWGTLQYTKAILEEAQAKGLKKIICYFMSEEAASAAAQPLPAKWKNLSLDELCKEAEAYCYKTTQYYKDNGIQIDLYEIGNEIERGIMGYFTGDKVQIPPGVDIQTNDAWMRENIWKAEAKLLKACYQGVKRADPNAKFILHGACFGIGANNTLDRNFFKAMIDFGVPYDIAGVSYYWDGIHQYENGMQPVKEHQEAYFKTDECKDFIQYIVHTLGKKFIFSEYVYQYDTPLGTVAGHDIGYPLTEEGQRKWIQDFLKFVNDTPEVSGCLYFYPEYFPNFHANAAYSNLNYAGLFNLLRQPNDALKEFNKYKK